MLPVPPEIGLGIRIGDRLYHDPDSITAMVPELSLMPQFPARVSLYSAPEGSLAV